MLAKRSISRLCQKITVLWLLLSSAQALAQDKIDSAAFYAGFTSTGTYNRTNSSSYYLLSNGIKLGLKKKDLVWNSTSKWLYGQENRNLTNNDFSSAWDVNLYKTFPRFYYWGLLLYNTSYSLKINSQGQGGLGIAYNFIDKTTSQINLSDGILYDYSDLNPTDSTRQVYGTFRNSLRLQLKWKFKERFTFSGNAYLQNSLQYGHDYIIKSDVSLSLRIWKWMSLSSTFSYNEMSRTKSQNLFVTYGLTIENNFKYK